MQDAFKAISFNLSKGNKSSRLWNNILNLKYCVYKIPLPSHCMIIIHLHYFIHASHTHTHTIWLLLCINKTKFFCYCHLFSETYFDHRAGPLTSYSTFGFGSSRSSKWSCFFYLFLVLILFFPMLYFYTVNNLAFYLDLYVLCFSTSLPVLNVFHENDFYFFFMISILAFSVQVCFVILIGVCGRVG